MKKKNIEQYVRKPMNVIIYDDENIMYYHSIVTSFSSEPNFMGDDYIEGYVDENIFIKIADIETSTYGSYRKAKMLFKGLFSITECNKNIGTYIKVTNNKKQYLSNLL